MILGGVARSHMMQLRVHVPQLGSSAVKEIKECLKNKSLALKVGSVMERKKEFGILVRGLLLTDHLVLNYFGSVCTEVILILDESFSSYNSKVCGRVHMQRRKIIWFFYAVIMLVAETVVGWWQQDE